MKVLALVCILFFSSLSLSAQDVKKEFMSLSVSNIEIFNNEVVPSLSFGLNPKDIDSLEFMVAYANNFLMQTSKNPKMQTVYLTLNYKF